MEQNGREGTGVEGRGIRKKWLPVNNNIIYYDNITLCYTMTYSNGT